jgi:DNA-binding transcriptional ArsR family regulator
MHGEQMSVESRARLHAALGEAARLTIVDTLLLGDASPGELARALRMPTNLLAHHLQVLRDAGLIVSSRSEGDGRRVYLQLVPGVLDRLPAPGPRPVPRVVFVCTHNSARSQLAAALWARRSTVPASPPARNPHDGSTPGLSASLAVTG